MSQSFNDFFFPPKFETPVTSDVSQMIGRAVYNHYRFRRKMDRVQTFYQGADIHIGTKFYHRDSIVVVHLTQKYPNKEWYYFQNPKGELTKKLFDRFNGVCTYAGLPTLHKIGDLWVWSDGKLWTGARLLESRQNLPIRPRLIKLLSNAWN